MFINNVDMPYDEIKFVYVHAHLSYTRTQCTFYAHIENLSAPMNIVHLKFYLSTRI